MKQTILSCFLMAGICSAEMPGIDGNQLIFSSATFSVPDNPPVQVKGEKLMLAKTVPAGFHRGTKLAGPRAAKINASGSLIEDSLVLRKADGTVLQKGTDYLISAPFALLGKPEGSSVADREPVFADYSYSVRRLDSVVADSSGTLRYLTGTPGVAAVKPPELPAGWTTVLNVYRPYGAETVEQEHLFPNLGNEAETGTTAGRIPETLRKLRAGENVSVVCWGDSVTVGADVKDQSRIYAVRFERMLKEKFPKADITVHNISVGSSQSPRWLNNWINHVPASKNGGMDFGRVLDCKPDLVTLEFVNDAGLNPSVLPGYYEKILSEIRSAGAELILITPHFTHPDLMGGQGLRFRDERPYTAFLRSFVAENRIALADASSRWENVWKTGIPYVTLLANSYNHPDGRGHAFFAEELIKCFKDSE